MKYDFSHVTDEQRARLFPILLAEADPHWPAAYLEQKAFVEAMFSPSHIVRIHHIGSTAVPNLLAKPTIDVLVEIAPTLDLPALIDRMQNNACVYIERRDSPPPHLMFLRGYTPTGFAGQAVHIHVRYAGDWDELYFRDYLIAHADVAAAYGDLKRQLKEQFNFDRDGYTAAKSEFVRRYTALAREAFGDRHRPNSATPYAEPHP
jgi:GrpB-like predicted nucleotidyltransferase (UPF0157 family)